MQRFCYEVQEYLQKNQIKYYLLQTSGGKHAVKKKRKKPDCLPFKRELIFRILKKKHSPLKKKHNILFLSNSK